MGGQFRAAFVRRSSPAHSLRCLNLLYHLLSPLRTSFSISQQMASRPPISDPSSLSPAREITRIAEMRSIHSSFLYLHNQEMEFRRWQRELTEIPAPPFGESARSEWLQSKFTALGLEDVHIDELGNVFGLLYPSPQGPGSPERTGFARAGVEGPGSPERTGFVRAGVEGPLIAISAHLDTVFPHGTALETREESSRLFGPGISDNAAGVVAILAMAAAIKRTQLRPATNIVFIGNVGEEGEGNLRGMRHIFSLSRWCDSIRSLLVIDGAGTDTYVNQALGSRRFEITFRGPG